MINKIRIVGRYKTRKYLLFYMNLYYNNKRDCPELVFGTKDLNTTKHGETGNINIKDCENNHLCYDILCFLEKENLSVLRKPLVNFKGVQYLGTYVPVQNKCDFDNKMHKSKSYNSIKNYDLSLIDLNKIKGTINVLPLVLENNLNIDDYIKKDRPNCDLIDFIKLETQFNFNIFILVFDCFS